MCLLESPEIAGYVLSQMLSMAQVSEDWVLADVTDEYLEGVGVLIRSLWIAVNVMMQLWDPSDEEQESGIYGTTFILDTVVDELLEMGCDIRASFFHRSMYPPTHWHGDVVSTPEVYEVCKSKVYEGLRTTPDTLTKLKEMVRVKAVVILWFYFSEMHKLNESFNGTILKGYVGKNDDDSEYEALRTMTILSSNKLHGVFHKDNVSQGAEHKEYLKYFLSRTDHLSSNLLSVYESLLETGDYVFPAAVE